MALDMNGSAAPVALITHPFAKCLADASQLGHCNLAGGPQNPIDAFDAADVPSGFALIILNSLSTPLSLVDSYEYDPRPGDSDYALGSQARYPAATDRVNAARQPHVIPGVRYYPRKARHPDGQGGFTQLGGVGLYNFVPAYYNYFDPGVGAVTAVYTQVHRALSFSADPNGQSGPLVAVAFRLKPHRSWTSSWFTVHSAVTVDLVGKYGDLATFYAQTMGSCQGMDDGNDPATILYEIGTGSNLMTAWACCSPDISTVHQAYAITFWVRDNASTF